MTRVEKVVYVDYALIDSVTICNRLERHFDKCECFAWDLGFLGDDDHFELNIQCLEKDLKEIEKILARYV